MAGDQPLELCCWQEGAWDGGRASVHQHIPGGNIPSCLCCLQGLLLLCTLSHLGKKRHRQLLQERFWEQGKALGKRKPKEPGELRTSDGSQAVCRLRAWRASVLFIARSVAGGARLESWPGERGGVWIWWAKGEQAESILLTVEPWKSAVPPELPFHLNCLHFLSLFLYKPAKYPV